MKDSHVLVRLDTDNGKAEFCKELGIQRNSSFAIILKVDHTSITTDADGNTLRPLEETARLSNPTKIEAIEKLLETQTMEQK